MSSKPKPWPWEAEPYRLWSLLDMLQLHAGLFVAIISNLSRVEASIATLGGLQSAVISGDLSHAIGTTLQASRDSAIGDLKLLHEEATQLPLSPAAVMQIERLMARLEASRDLDAIEIRDEARLLGERTRTLKELIIDELTSILFLKVDRPALYLDYEDWFGQATLDRFPAAARDIRDACQCCALEMWTATVFHAMRAAEHGLKALARELQADCADAIDYKGWNALIASLENKIKTLPRTHAPREQDDLQFYSEAATHLRYFKDAYRNPVDHARVHHDEQTARHILDAVKRFMGHLATRAPYEAETQ